MKRVSFVLAFAAGIFLGCGQPQYTNTDISPKKIKVIKDYGEEASKMLLSELKEELKTALKTKGPIGAIEVCSQKALTITKEVAEDMGDIEIKRTTFKYRNPNNKPDPYEADALQFFEKELKERGKLPPYYIQKVNGEYRYYKPLKIQGVCLTCHGDPAHMDKNLVKKLKEIYPQDKATGYKLGDFRGVIRVSIPEDVIKKSCL